MLNFLTFGETLVQHNADYIGPYDPNGPYTRYVAGAESNVALNLKRLMSDQVSAVWISRLGADADGDMIRDALAGRIEIYAPRMDGEFTGVQLLNHLGDGEVVRRYRRAGSAASRLDFQEDDIRASMELADLLHVTGITPALSERCAWATKMSMSSATVFGVPIVMDVNYREALWGPEDARAVYDYMRKQVAIFKVGLDEAEAVWGYGFSASEYAQWFHMDADYLFVINIMKNDSLYTLNLPIITIVTTGDTGAVADFGAYDDQVVAHPGFSVDVVDPVGAGDAFMAGVLASIYASGGRRAIWDFALSSDADKASTLQDALELGNACGALVCTQHGDTEPMPTMAQAREFIARRRI